MNDWKRSLLALLAVAWTSALSPVSAQQRDREESRSPRPKRTYWTIYQVPRAEECQAVPGTRADVTLTLCAATEVTELEILEASTAEILGRCDFRRVGENASDTAFSPSSRSERFWCQRRVLPDGTTSLRIDSDNANLPTLRVVRRQKRGTQRTAAVATDGVTRTTSGPDHPGMWDEIQADPADGVVHPNVGTAPYVDPELPIAGFKLLRFSVRNLAQARDVWSLPEHAGYTTGRHTFDNGVAEVYVHTRDSRAKLERDVLQPAGWIPRANPKETFRNVGRYDHQLTVSAGAFGIALVPKYPTETEKPVDGTLYVSRDTTPADDAVVTVNGTRLSFTGDGFDVSPVPLAPGSKVDIEITTGDHPRPIKLNLHCPKITITSPEDGSAVAGGPVPVTWTPAIPAKPVVTFIPAPVAGQLRCKLPGGALTRDGTGTYFKELNAGQTEVTLTDVDGSCAESIIEVRAASELATDAEHHSAICYLYERIRQRKQD